MRSSTPADLAGRCPRCFLPDAACLCSAVKRQRPSAEFLILRHIKEAWRTSNTARLAALALEGCRVLDYGRAGQPIPAPPDLSRTWLLFPDGPPQVPPGSPDRVIVLDGTWGQARRMVQRLAWLRGLPRLSLVPSAPPDGLRREPDDTGMPTVIAIARALDALEGPGWGAPLDALHTELVSRARALRGGPNVLKPIPPVQVERSRDRTSRLRSR